MFFVLCFVACIVSFNNIFFLNWEIEWCNDSMCVYVWVMDGLVGQFVNTSFINEDSVGV